MKLKDAVEMICDLENLVETGDRRDRYEKARFLVRMGVINPDSEVSRGQTAQYRLDTICALRLCFALYDCGMEFAAVSKIARSFHHPMEPGRDPNPHESLSTAISAIRSGKNALFFIVISKLAGQATTNLTGVFEIDGQPLIQRFESPIVDESLVSEIIIRVPLNRLLKSIIELFDDLDG